MAESAKSLPRTTARSARECGDEPRSETFRGAETSRIENFWIGVNILNFPEGKHPKAMDVSPWYGVYKEIFSCIEFLT